MSFPNSDSLDSMVSGLHGTDASVRLVLEASAEDYDEGSDEWEEGEVLEEMVARHLAWKSMRRSGAMKKPVGGFFPLPGGSLALSRPVGAGPALALLRSTEWGAAEALAPRTDCPGCGGSGFEAASGRPPQTSPRFPEDTGALTPENHLEERGAVSLSVTLVRRVLRPGRALAGRPVDRSAFGRRARPPVGGVAVRAHLRGAQFPGGPPERPIYRETPRTFLLGPLLTRAQCAPGPGLCEAACW
ncbi:hypothetical protein NDU88_003857 [Pleurodeles waltl]|uniref:Uncharacterized protein n=1 Tax=Pleurodeles waltl TaxID=8319 RepID=A0AAV7SH78_PLEWA|nr:hypothetical protein NDU88_003857 [Pleurodeles waltl]